MKNRIKRSFALALAFVLLVSVFPFGSVSAASWPSFGSNCCEFIAQSNIPVYRDQGLSTRGTANPAKSYNAYVDPGDVCHIYGISGGSVLIDYPTSSGYKTGYAAIGKVLGCSAPAEQTTSRGRVTTCRTPGGASYGYVDTNDTVWKLYETGSFTAVMYTAKSGSRTHKVGFVSTREYNNTIGGGTQPKPAAPSTASSAALRSPLKGGLTRTSVSSTTNGIYCDYSAASGTALYAPCDGTAVFRQVTASKNGTTKLASYANYIEFQSSDGRWKIKTCHLSEFNGVKTTIRNSWPYPCGVKQYSCTTNTLSMRKVSAGDVLGWTGATGNASGPHLHLEVYENVNGSWVARNPVSVMAKW